MSTRYVTNSHYLSSLLVILYCFLVPLGGLAKFGQGNSAIGFPTILIFSVVALRFKYLYWAAKNDLFMSTLVVFLCYLVGVSIIGLFYAGEDIYLSGVFGLGTLIIYACFGLAVGSLTWSQEDLSRLAFAMTIGLSISLVLTYVDLFGFYDIPRVNELEVATWLEGEAIVQAHGPFSHRTALAVFMSLMLPFLFLEMHLNRKPLHRKLMFWLVLFASIGLLMLSHNRSAPIAIMLSVLFIRVYFLKSPISFVVKTALILFVLVILFMAVFPDAVRAYVFLFSGYFGKGSAQYVSESDGMRAYLLGEVFSSLTQNPFGVGLIGKVSTLKYGWYDAHSVYGNLLLSGGVISIIFLSLSLFYFCKTAKSVARNSLGLPGAAILSSLLCWALVGLMHDVLNVGLLWVFLGIYVSFYKSTRYPAKSHLQNDGSVLKSKLVGGG